MELKILKYGNLAGSPDIKTIMHDLKYDTAAVDQFWDHTHAIKLAFGLDGRSTSALLLEPDCPELFPALVDCSFLSADPATHGPASIDMALAAIRAAGVDPAHIKAHFVTHPHGDHMDPRLRQALPGALFLAHPDSGIPANPIDVKSLPDSMAVINTPGHGYQHCSYIVDLKQHDLSVCLAGDLIMSHAHFLTLDHPTAFADPQAGAASVRAVLNALAQRHTKYKMILPGHDIPFFVNP
jgi:glyoxylase-like metal-dependent hydrolase (beta-lactamase superfamily II)